MQRWHSCLAPWGLGVDSNTPILKNLLRNFDAAIICLQHLLEEGGNWLKNFDRGHKELQLDLVPHNICLLSLTLARTCKVERCLELTP